MSGNGDSPTSNYRRTLGSSPDSRHRLTGPCLLGAWVLSSLLSILCPICHILSTTSSRFVPGMGALLFLHDCYPSCKIAVILLIGKLGMKRSSKRAGIYVFSRVGGVQEGGVKIPTVRRLPTDMAGSLGS